MFGLHGPHYKTSLYDERICRSQRAERTNKLTAKCGEGSPRWLQIYQIWLPVMEQCSPYVFLNLSRTLSPGLPLFCLEVSPSAGPYS